MCTSPITLKTYHYLRTPKNDKDTLYKQVPCGKCPECLRTRSNQWSFRLQQELANSYNASFVTMTYDDAYLQQSPQMVDSVYQPHVKDFLDRLKRKNFRFWLQGAYNMNHKRFDKLPKCCRSMLLHDMPPLRYFLTSEYGEHSARPHYHMLLFNCLLPFDQVDELWQLGNSFFGGVTDGSIRYVTKYFCNHQDSPAGALENFTMCSNSLGLSYLKDPAVVEYLERNKDNNCRLPLAGGGSVSVPRYYREKTFIKFTYDNIQSTLESYIKKYHKEHLPYEDQVKSYQSWLAGQEFNFERNLKKPKLL